MLSVAFVIFPLNVIILSVVMMNVVMLSVIILSVVAALEMIGIDDYRINYRHKKLNSRRLKC